MRFGPKTLTLLFVVLCSTSIAVTQQPTGTASVSGRVTRSDTGAPVQRAAVQLSALTGVSVRSLKSTPESGDFSFSDLPAGEYRLTWSATGLANPDASVLLPFGSGRLIKIADGQRLSNVQLPLSPMPMISGRVSDQAGKPMAGVRVSLSNLRNRLNRPEFVLVNVQIAQTDTDGKYRFADVIPGDYYVLASAAPFDRVDATDSPVVPDRWLPFAPTYFPGTASVFGARPVRVTLGIDAPDVTIPLVPSELVPVSGHVFNKNGQPAPDATVLMIPTEAGEAQTDVAVRARSDANGRFAYPGIPPGPYVLQVFNRGAFGSRTVGVPTIPEGVAGIEVTVRPPVSARGRLRFEGGPAPDKENVWVTFARTDFASGPIGSNSMTVKPGEDWSFALHGLAWIGLIRVIPPKGWALKSVMLNGRDIVDVPSDFQTADVNGLELVMTNRLASIVGTVTDGNKPVTSLILILPESIETGAPRMMGGGGSNTDGTFQISGVLAGR